MPLILPEQTNERHAIEAAAQQLLAKADVRVPAMRKHVADVIEAAVASIPVDRLNRGIEQHDWTLIVESLPVLTPDPYVPLAKAKTPSPEDAIDGLTENLEAISRNAATFGASIVPRFDLVDQHAVDFARTRAGRLLTDLDRNALTNAREAVAYGIENGRTVEQTSRYLRSTLYVPPRGEKAIRNYFDALIARVEDGDDIQEAARAAARGRALAPKQFLDAKNIDTLTERYAAQWVKYTAESVARTMTIEASNAGLRDGWEQAADAGFFDKATARIVWYATNDDMVCPECSMLNGTTIGFDGEFATSGGMTPYPPAHPSCRCTTVLVTDLRDVPRVQGRARGFDATGPRSKPKASVSAPPAPGTTITTESGVKNGTLGVRRAKALQQELDAQGVPADSPIRGVIDHPYDHLAVARNAEGNITGAMAFTPNDGIGQVVPQDFRAIEKRTGVGQALMEHVARAGLDAGAEEMQIYSAVGNAIPFYARMGAAPSENVNSHIIHWSNEALRALAGGKPIPYLGDFPAFNVRGAIGEATASPPGKPTIAGIEKVRDAFRDAHPGMTFDVGHSGDYITIRSIDSTENIGDSLKEIAAYADASNTTVAFDRDILDPLPVARRRELRAAAREYGFVSNNTGKIMDTPDLLVRVAGKKPKPIKPKEPKVTKPEPKKPKASGPKGKAYRLTSDSDGVSWDMGAKARFGDLLDQINTIHAYAPKAPPGDLRINLRDLRAEKAGGLYNPASRILEVSSVEGTSYADLAFMHELGHSMDSAWGQGTRSWVAQAWATRGSNISTWTEEQLQAWNAFNTAAAKTKMINGLREAYNHQSPYRQHPEWNQEFISYLLDKREVWARAYSQWMANQLYEPGVTRSALRAARSSPYQWSDADFKKLGEAVEGVLKAMGLM